jgi:cytosine/adenosine deaminase-related metal-dependent hydrolase
MRSAPSILLQGGTLLLHGSEDHVTATKADLLIQGNKIAKIAPEILPPSHETKLIDCRNKLVSPGFIDTHRHLWQTQLKGRHADELLLDYLPTGNLAGSLFTAGDIFWGELAGALGSIDAGTTTVVDHAHMNYSIDHSTNAVSALVSSGVRSFFCYCANSRVKSWNPEFALEADIIPDWFVKQLHELTRDQPFGDGRVQIGLAWNTWYLPKEVIVKIFEQARSWGVKLITCHHGHGPTLSALAHLIVYLIIGFLAVEPLVSWGLLSNDVLVSHAANATSEEADQLVKSGAHVSSTPSTELQMSLGIPVCFRSDLHSISSLGIDCHSVVSADIPGQMRLALQNARGIRNQAILDTGKTPRSIKFTVEQAFNLGTIKGARAVGMESEIGSLEEGKLADIVVFFKL